MQKSFLKRIANPDNEYRGTLFWAWNGKLDDVELRRQIRIMKSMGFGGFFMQARIGLKTPYLGKQWFDCIRTSIDEAEKLEMKPWLYDEDRFPSGAAGGFATKEEKYRQRKLAMDVTDAVPGDFRGLLAVFAAKINGKNADGIRRLVPGDQISEGEKVLAFRCEICPPSSWYNGQAYLDTLNEEAVRKFIEITYNAYKHEISDKFGKPVPGIFSDEPNFYDGFYQAGWTDSIPARFIEKFGYDLLDHLPELFYYTDQRKFSKTRVDFYGLCTEMFVNAFSRQIGEWCGKNNLEFTGHVLDEDDLVLQTPLVGSAMRFYEFMQTPGMDLLTEHWGIFITAKQCTSMAHQFGRPRRLSETSGCTGWDFSFAGQKACCDWQYALGINYRSVHLGLYTMDNEAKRDYPPSVSFQAPYCRHFHVVEDYFGRLGAALAEGEEQRELLVIHPIESVWGVFLTSSRRDEEMMGVRRYEMIRLVNKILAANIDFDFGDEEIIFRFGMLKNKRIFVNKASYGSVLLPEMLTVRGTTLNLLKQFSDAGGKVFYFGNPPEFVEGEKSAAAKEIYKQFTSVMENSFITKIEPCARLVSITSADDGTEIGPALHIMRKSASHTAVFICNFSTEFIDWHKNYDSVSNRKLEFPSVKVSVPGNKGETVYELELFSGKIWRHDSTFQKGKYEFMTSLPPLGSRMFFISKENIANTEPPHWIVYGSHKPVLSLPESGWKYSTDEFNAMVFDHVFYSVDGGPQSEKKYILFADDDIREKLGVQPRDRTMVQPWLSDTVKTTEKSLRLTLNYFFKCEVLPACKSFLALEHPEFYDIQINGIPLNKSDEGYWCDPCIRRLFIPPESFGIGDNSIVLKTVYHARLPGLESIFLLGEFGLKQETIIALPDTLSTGDWCEQGFQNYAGNMTYRTSFVYCPEQGERAILSIPDWRGVALEIRVNHSEPALLWCPPYEADITDDLKKGENLFEITVVGHRRNVFGPFYLDTASPNWTGPAEFRKYTSSERKLVPCGLLKPPFLKFSSGYSVPKSTV